MFDESHYIAALVQLNKGASLQVRNMVYRPGMGFSELDKWWAGGGKRKQPHEGIDLCWYEDAEGKERFLLEGTRIPSLLSGTIVAVADDFMGKTVFVRNSFAGGQDLIAAHSHIKTEGQCGDHVHGGDLVGVIAPASLTVPAHLHLSLLQAPRLFPVENLNWNFLTRKGQGLFVHPFSASVS